MLISKMHQLGILVTTSSVGFLIQHHLVLHQIAISMKLTLRKLNEGQDKGEDKSGFSQKVMPLLPFIPQLPEELKSEKAARILMRLYKEEILDENFQPLNLSGYQKAYLAYQISVALGINNVWKVFSRFWNMKPSVMRTRYNDALSMPSILDFGEKIKEYLR